jgi:pilus assembly protein CpaF
VIIQANRLSDGTRKLTSIHEVTGMEGDTVTLQEIFVFKQTGVGPTGAVEGYFSATGVRPRCWDRLTTRGADLPQGMFLPQRQVV